MEGVVSDRFARAGIALVAAAGILVLAGWLDGQVFVEIRRQEAASFDPGQLAWTLPVGYLAVAAGVLAVTGLALWSRSLLVGVAYMLVGTFFAFLFTIVWQFSAEINGAPPVLPRPVAQLVGNLDAWGAQGPLNAWSVIGAGMLLAGLATISRVVRRRAARRRSGAPAPEGRLLGTVSGQAAVTPRSTEPKRA